MDPRISFNAHHQPIGPDVPGWTPPPRPVVGTILGVHCTLEPLTAAHTDELFAELGGIDPSLWTWWGEDPIAEATPFEQYVTGRRAGPPSASGSPTRAPSAVIA